MRTRARAFRRPTAAPSPPVVVVLFFRLFRFRGCSPVALGRWESSCTGFNIVLQEFWNGRRCVSVNCSTLHTLESQMQAFLGKAGASRSEHGCPAISAGTSGKLTWKLQSSRETTHYDKLHAVAFRCFCFDCFVTVASK